MVAAPRLGPQSLFAAEFTIFLVAVAGASIAVLRPQLLAGSGRVRPLLGLALISLAAAAFGRGSLLGDHTAPALVLLQLAGSALLAVTAAGWKGDRTSRRWLWGALTATAAADAAALSGFVYWAGWSRAAGALCLGFVLVVSARRSISARFALSVAATLLLGVLALSVTLSLVIGSTVEREALKRVEARARAEAEEITESALSDAVNSARLAALTIQGSRADELLALAEGQPGGSAPDVIARDLRLLADQDLLVADGPMLYVTSQRTMVVAQRVDQASADALLAARVVNPVVEGRAQSNSGVLIVGNQALAAGMHRVTARGPQGATLVGLVIATLQLDSAYLTERARGDPAVTLSLAGADRVFASVGSDLTQEAVLKTAQAALAGGGAASAVVSGLFLAAREVGGPDSRPGLVVLSSFSTSAEGTQASLFRILFLVALVTSLIAFVLAVAVGERIGRGLGRLTTSARQISEGDLSVRASVGTQDELGVLGAAFDSMAASIETLADELRQSVADEAGLRARLEAVVAGMGEALIAVDGAGRVTIYNSAAEQLFGRSAEEVIGRPVSELGAVTTEDGTDLMSLMSAPSGRTWSQSAVLCGPDGTRVPVALSAGDLTGPDGQGVGGVYVLRDMRREREAERAKAELLANISHELRTPLVPIKGYAQLLLRRGLSAERSHESLREIVVAADRLESAVDRLIEVASQETDATPAAGAVELSALVEAVMGRWRARVDDRHSLVTVVAADLPPVVGDRAALERCLDELVDNAVKFSPEGGEVKVEVVTAAEGADAEVRTLVEISVHDHGIGIAADRLDSIFEAFAQADGSATREFGGLGVGLALVRRIVAAHGGELRATSVLGQGSTFSVRLPVAAGAPVVAAGS